MGRLTVVALLCWGMFAGAAEKHSKPAPPASAHAGVAERVFHPKAVRNWRGAAHQELRVTVWHPAPVTAVETPQYIGPPDAPLFQAGSASPHAPFAPSLDLFPLIVLSHGSGGSAEQMAWLGTALARAGFIVAAVDHPGNNATEPYTPAGFVLWWERATDLSEVIDGMLADETFGPKIDKARIGAAGFSLGGYTVMELAGARTDISEVYDRCRAQPDRAECHAAEMKGMGTPPEMLQQVRKTSGISLAASADSYRDPRVKAVFAIAPGLGYALVQESLREIRVPVEIVVGGADPIAPAEENADYLRANIRGAREEVLPGGVAHYTFLDTCTAAGRQSAGVYCSDLAGVDRDKVHEQVAEEAVEFFVHALKLR
jgi:predicted dienelactone hydrolase